MRQSHAPDESDASVPDLAPFRGLRYTTGSDLTAVTAPPYDVIDADERAALLASDPNNSVRLILPDDSSGDPYEGAATTLAKWRADGVLEVDPVPMLYAYRMEAPRPAGGTHRTVGVIGALALPGQVVPGEALADDVLPHERTLPKAKSDRLALLRATRANFDPIWGLTLSTGLTELVAVYGYAGEVLRAPFNAVSSARPPRLIEVVEIVCGGRINVKGSSSSMTTNSESLFARTLPARSIAPRFN